MKKRILSIVFLLILFFAQMRFITYARSSNEWEQIFFFGDSTTHGLIRYIVENDGHLGTPIYPLQRDQILTPPDGTFYLRNLPTAIIRYRGQNLPLSAAFSQIRPPILVITVGINGLPTWSETDFTLCYTKLIELIQVASPDTRIILHSVYPTAQSRSPKLVSFTVDKIDRLNSWIRTIAQANTVTYIDSATQLKSHDGWLNPAYHNGDGLHLNTNGFNLILENLYQQLILKGEST